MALLTVSTSSEAANPLAVCRARSDQLPIIASLAHDIWHCYYPSIISTAQIDYMLSQRYTIAALSERQAKRGSLLLIAWLGPLAVGYAFLSTPDDAPDEATLDAFYLHPDYHRRGLGTRFMDNVITQVREQPCRTLTLNVNRLNITALNFYFHVGFTLRSAVDIDFGRGFFGHDFVMERALRSD